MGAADETRMRELARFLAPVADPTDVVLLQVMGAPTTKKRHRTTKTGKTYDPPENRAAQARLRAHLRRAFRSPWTGNVAVGAVFFRPDRRIIDGDNTLKMVLDSMNTVVVVDDSQVTAKAAFIELDAARPRTLLAIAPAVSTLARGTDDQLVCTACGAAFPRERGQARVARCPACSRPRPPRLAAAAKTRPAALAARCAACQQPFRRAYPAQTTCCGTCRRELTATTEGTP